MNQILVTEKVIVTPGFKRKRKLYKFNFFLSVFLSCTLFSCYIYAEYDRTKGEQVSQEILAGLDIPEEEATQTGASPISVENDRLVIKLSGISNQESTEITLTDEDTYWGNYDQPETSGQTRLMEAVSPDGVIYDAEAVLNIPSLEICYPVLPETTEELLKLSVSKLWGPSPNTTGNYVIAGHNYKNKTMFGKLPNIEMGAVIELTDATGRTLQYEVYDKYEIEPTDVSCTSQFTDGRRDLTLITCNSNGKKRVVVKATEIL